MNLVSDYIKACQLWGVPSAIIRGPAKPKDIVNARTSIIICLLAMGHRRTLIAKTVNRKGQGSINAAVGRACKEWFGDVDWARHQAVLTEILKAKP